MTNNDRDKFEALTELELHKRIVNYFNQWFNIQSEVTSDCKTKRVDILLFHKSDTDKLFPIAIELKKTNVKRGTDIANWCIQANGYTKLSFNKYKPVIFITPQISGWYLDEGERVSKHPIELPGSYGCHNNINSFLYRSFNFGELQKYYFNQIQCFRFVINTYQIWDSRQPNIFNIKQLALCQ